MQDMEKAEEQAGLKYEDHAEPGRTLEQKPSSLQTVLRRESPLRMPNQFIGTSKCPVEMGLFPGAPGL